MSLTDTLSRKGIPYQTQLSLASVCSMRCGGEASLWITPRSTAELLWLLRLLAEEAIPYRIVGAMTNTLAPDGVVPYPLISTVSVTQMEDYGDRVTVACGTRTAHVAHRFMKDGRDVLAGISTVPGTVGGAVRGNAGAFGHEMADYVAEARVFDPATLSVYTLSHEDMAFAYRDSRLKHTGEVLLSVTLCSTERSVEQMLSEERTIQQRRRQTQPSEPSLGSIFLRTEDGISPARLIDDCGMKGLRIGGAQISPVHAGFIVNAAHAKSADVRALIFYIKQRIYERYGVPLRCEICMLPKEV